MRCLRLPLCSLIVWLALSGGACGGGGELLGRFSPAAAGGATSGGGGVGGTDNSGGGGAINLGGANGGDSTDGLGGASGGEPGITLGPFGPAVLVSALSDPNAADEDPTVTGDLLELFFTSNRTGDAEIWVSRRSSPQDAWGSPSLVSELQSPEQDWTPSVSPDGLTLWFSSTRPANYQAFNIWVTTRPSRDSPWSAPVEVQELSTDDDEIGPATDEDDLVMMFGSYTDDAWRWDMYVSTRPDRSSAWPSAVRISELSSAGDDWDVFVNRRGRQVFFISNREGNYDLYQAARESLSSPFAPATPLTELNTPFDETDPALSLDERHIFFGSNRSGDPEIYTATR